MKIKKYKNKGANSKCFRLSKNKKDYFLKVYLNSTSFEIKKEVNLVRKLKLKEFTKPIKQISYKKKPAVIFEYININASKKINKKKIKEICKFLFKLQSKKIKNIKKQTSLKKLIKQSKKRAFIKRYEKIKNIVIKKNSLIHGDLFFNNVIFKNDKLVKVVDYSELSLGNKYFDLCTIINQWCFKKKKIRMKLLKKAISYYNLYTKDNICMDFLKEYMLYSALYFSVTRYINKNKYTKKLDYKEYLKKFDFIEKNF